VNTSLNNKLAAREGTIEEIIKKLAKKEQLHWWGCQRKGGFRPEFE
jgi:hypothetical protein